MIFGSLLLLFALYVAWRALVVWHEVRQERMRLKENLIWMREERKRRATKIVGILSARERREGAARQEQMMKRVRFAEALEGNTGGEAALEYTLDGPVGLWGEFY